MKYYGLTEIPIDRILVYDIDTNPINLDPAYCTDYIGQIICQALYEPLFIRSIDGREWQLGAAESYNISSDGLIHTFHLPNHKYWSDGVPVVADDFVFAFQRLLSPVTKSPIAGIFDCILHAEEVREGLLPITELGVKALDTFTLQITLAYQVPFLKALLGSPYAAPIPRHIAEINQFVLPSITNGPFILSDYVSNQYVHLDANPYYPSPKDGVRGIHFLINRNLGSSLEFYKQNHVHITCNTYFPFNRIIEFKQYSDFHIEESSILFFMLFNQNRHKFFSDNRIRKALYYAIDKELISRQLQGGVSPWNHFVSKGLVGDRWSNKEVNNTFNPDQARQLLKNSGYYNDLMNHPLNIIYADFYPNREIIEMIQEMWQSILEVKVNLVSTSFEEHTQFLETGNYDLCLALLTPIYSDPFCSFQYFLPDVETGIDEKLIDYLEQSLEEEEERRWETYFRIDTLLRELLPGFPLFNGKSIYMVKPTIKGYVMFPDGGVSFRNLRWRPISRGTKS
ncbi:peptide ABC transporter substrate-binding protein [Brevibacillus thermoruber]|uniref:peptide ABC transporter substrate-binding protein n=1 Tax=Brevibacillus thermoruber TaxID=33942 RepID=UPI0009DF71C2|nr:peptide ABC transporter substrate-binding protein [Brevibacillus thermoruber]